MFVNSSKISKILKRQIFIELLTEMFLGFLLMIILFLSIFVSSLFFIIFIFYILLLVITYFLVSKDASVFIPIYKVNKYSKSKTIDLVDSLIEQYEIDSAISENNNTNFFSNNSNASDTYLSNQIYSKKYRSINRMNSVENKSGVSKRVMSRNMKALKELKILLEDKHYFTSEDIWDE